MIRGAALIHDVTLFNDADTPDGASVFGDPFYEPLEGVTVPGLRKRRSMRPKTRSTETYGLNRYMAILEIDVDVDGLSEVEWEGERYSVQGEPKRYSTHRGSHHYEIEMKGIEG